jgi:uncharacterized membrane-anchored protein
MGQAMKLNQSGKEAFIESLVFSIPTSLVVFLWVFGGMSGSALLPNAINVQVVAKSFGISLLVSVALVFIWSISAYCVNKTH